MGLGISASYEIKNSSSDRLKVPTVLFLLTLETCRTLIGQDTVTNAAIGGSDEVVHGSLRLLSQSDRTAPLLHAPITKPSNSHLDNTPPQSTPVQQHQINSLAYYLLINWNL
jgi:hypothetical protein